MTRNHSPVLRRYPERVIILEDLDFGWTAEVLAEVRKMWEAGVPLAEMAGRLRRDPDEVGLAIIHLARQGEIQSRPGAVFGTEVSR